MGQPLSSISISSSGGCWPAQGPLQIWSFKESTCCWPLLPRSGPASTGRWLSCYRRHRCFSSHRDRHAHEVEAESIVTLSLSIQLAQTFSGSLILRWAIRIFALPCQWAAVAFWLASAQLFSSAGVKLKLKLKSKMKMIAHSPQRPTLETTST